MCEDKTTVFNKILRLFRTGLIVLVLVAGCVSKPDATMKNETPTNSPSSTIVSPAPFQLYIKAGQSEEFTYKSHIIKVNYTSAYPIQIVKITFDGIEKIIQKETAGSPAGVYWKAGSFSFTLKPVVWEIRDSEKIPFYEKTWNTTELYFEAFGE